MKRNIILFLLAFLATIGVGAGLWFLLLSIQPPDPGKDVPQTTEVRPAGDPQPQPGPKDKDTATPQPAGQDPAADTPGRNGGAGSNAPADATPAGNDGTEGQNDALVLSEKPRSAEHKAALLAEAALKSDDPAASLQRLTERGVLSEEAAEALKQWAQDNKAAQVEEVGSYRRADGAKATRFRIKSADGKEDMLVDAVTQPDGSVRIETAKTAASDKTQVAPASDPMTVAEGFVEAVKRGDMLVARRLVTGDEVSDATVAGLCMVFEEGSFALRDNSPIRNTFQNEDRAGYLVYVVSPGSNKPCNIGLELAKASQGWRVSGVALDTLLSRYEDSANAEGGHYFPIVKNPKGGDSLALFFAFNEYELTPRSRRQLQIVAELLKQSKGKLDISGHTDDVGSEQYNLSLSERRAEAVKAALVSFGVQPEQIATQGLGKSQPRRQYKAEDSEQQIDYIRGENRRAEIYLDFKP